MRCWGSNANGQIGVGDTDTTSSYLVPAAAIDFSGHTAKKLAKAGNPCAILDDDSLRCWGSNIYGQAGYPATTPLYTAPSATPVDFGTGKAVLAVATNGSASCFILGDGSVRCTGNLGVNDWWSQYSASFTAADQLLAPIDLGTDTPAADLAISGSNYCVIMQSSGTLRCTGNYYYGQQGLGLPTFRLLPPTSAVLNLGP